jgi:pyruvate carboxylase
MAGTTSQPSMSALVAALEHTERDTGMSLRNVMDLEPYWEAVRKLYRPFESGLPGPTGRVYDHEIPGGQLSNLRQQAMALGLGDRFEQIEAMYAAADHMLGRLVKVTPSSKVVGDLALHLVAGGVDPQHFAEAPGEYDVPDSVIGFLGGELGTPPGGWPEPFRTKALADRRPMRQTAPLSDADRAELTADSTTRRNRLNHLLFPAPTKEFEQIREKYGDVSVLDTRTYLYGMHGKDEVAIDLGPGVHLLVGMEGVGDADQRGMRTVMFTLNGQLRPMQVRDTSVEVDVVAAERADPGRPGHIASPFAGAVTPVVQEGQQVEAGTTVATIEAMKMEAAITTPIAGTVRRLAIGNVQQVEGGDLVLVIE